MAYNSPKFDKQAYYDAMTMRQLQEAMDWWEDWIKKRTGQDRANAIEELAFIRLQRAERFNKGKTK